jgi:glutaminyl-peptide cyclotransferase
MRLFLMTTALALLAACGGSPTPKANTSVTNTNANTTKQTSGPAPTYGYEVVKAYPHDPKAFTEGLFFHDGFLYESTGQERHSTLRKVELETGKVVKQFELPPEDFGEGIAMVNNQIYQLTWRQGLCRVFDPNDFKLIREFDYQGEGWGMTTDGQKLYMTDSTHIIRVMDPDTFKPIRTIPVFREDGRPLMQINELEWVKGEIWANIWHSEDPDILGKPNYIVRIDPSNGKILGWIDLGGISPDDQPKDSSNPYDAKAENTLNGIAYDEATDRIFVTGKNWKKLYEIRLRSKQ